MSDDGIYNAVGELIHAYFFVSFVVPAIPDN